MGFLRIAQRKRLLAEWRYWANRYINDKHDWNAMLGAMQWHQLRGRVVGL